MRVAMVTREWPPDIYGGAGVHIENLVEHLRDLAEVNVHCFGGPRTDAIAQSVPPYLEGANAALQTLGVDVGIAGSISPETDIVHSHTWYANLAGHITSLLHGVPHVLTGHSLEPHRPWKREQLHGGYEISSWVERTSYRDCDAVIAVSHGMRADILDAYPEVDPTKVHVVHNGINTQTYSPDSSTEALQRYGISSHQPYAIFVGRITRQKGLVHLLRAARSFDPSINLVLCASSPDTPEIAEETARAVEVLRGERREGSVIWIEEQVDRTSLIQLLTHALVFTCPSIYEPLGIVNLEAMACETAVVASSVGGIPEVVEDGVTGTLVHYDSDDPDSFEVALASAVNDLAADPAKAADFGRRGRERAVNHFGWGAIAEQTIDVYRWAATNQGRYRG